MKQDQLFLIRQLDILKIQVLVLIFFCSGFVLHAQNITVRGKVTDAETGIALPGVNVVLKGTTSGVITDINGNYTIESANGQAVLLFSYIGYIAQEYIADNTTILNVALKTEAKELDEVIVVGYGSQKKESVVGAISQTTGEELTRMNTPDVTNALTGLVPGLVTIQTSGIPGGSGDEDSPTKMYIRGLSTWNGGGPLILVDGVERDIQDLDPGDIESLSVLKDASATAVFGVKGANGVILITTKRGKESKPQISFEGQTTLKAISKVYHPLGSYDANLLKNIAIINELPVTGASWSDFKPQEILNYYRDNTYPELYPDINWYDEMTRDFATSYKMSLNVRGGSSSVSYFSSLSFLHEGDILQGDNLGQGYNPGFRYDRINFRTNLDFKLSESTKLSVNLSGNYGSRADPKSNPRLMWWGIYGHPPDTYPIRYSDGIYADYDGFDKQRNSYTLLNFEGLEKYNRSQILGDMVLDQKLDFLFKGLSFNTKVSVDNYFETQGTTSSAVPIITKYIMPEVLNVPAGGDESLYTVWKYPSTGADGYNFVETPSQYNPERIGATNGYSRQLFYQFSLNYNRSFYNHHITALALFNRNESAKGSNFLNKREDWVSRVTYNYDYRYFVEFNGAYNGSEKFGKEYRYGFFPSYALGWMISNEEFFKKAVPFINILKVRYSNGKVGSDSGVPRWLYTSGWNYTGYQMQFGNPYIQNTGYPIYLEDKIANPDARWETAQKRNLGIESGLLKNRLKINADYFWEHRYDMLIKDTDRTSNDIFGTNLPSANLGEVESHGYEIDMSYNHTTRSKLNLNSRFTMGYAIDKILERDDPELKPDYQKLEGHQIFQIVDYYNGEIFQNWNDLYGSVQWDSRQNTLPGDISYIDYNADGKITLDDKVPIGYPQRPQYNYSLSLGTSYKGFSASVMFYGVFNVSRPADWGEFAQGYSIVYPKHYNSWAPELGYTSQADFRSMRYLSQNIQVSSGSQSIMDASYLRLQNVELAYDFKNLSWTENIGVSNLGIYIRGNNLFIWTDMYEDRDANASGSGEATYSYPVMKRFTIGLTVGF